MPHLAAFLRVDAEQKPEQDEAHNEYEYLRYLMRLTNTLHHAAASQLRGKKAPTQL